MTAPADPAARRAARLLHWYPAAWRSRYGEEFTELLLAEFTERPRSWRRAADVARGGLLARLAGAGLTGRSLEPAQQARAGLATAAWALAAFLIVGVAMWAQLTIGWEWAPPGRRAATVALVAMSAAAAFLAVLAVLAAIPLTWSVARALKNHPERPVRRSALCALTGTGLLVTGSHRRLDLSLRVLRYEAWLASAAAAAMAVFLAGACCWVLAEGSGPGLFHAGTVDVAGLAVMMLALSTAQRATGLARKSVLGPRPR